MRVLPSLLGGLLALVYTNAQAAQPLSFSLEQLKNDKIITVTEKSWPDNYLLIAVGYTTCPDICPTTLLDMRSALKYIEKDAPESFNHIQPLFVTIDPTKDTLENITLYASHFSPKIIGLRASNFKQLNSVVDNLRASYGYLHKGKYVEPPNLPQGYTVMHSTLIYLYSPDGTLVDAFPYNMDGKTLAQSIIQHMKKAN